MNITDTARLRLRTVAPGDAGFYLELVNDPAFIEYIGDRNLHTLEAARKALGEGPVAMHARLGFSLYIVELKEDDTPIGMCGLIKRDSLDDVDIGYAFLPAYRGQGYALEAARAVFSHARALGLKRLLAIASPGNAASIHLLDKLGLQFQQVVYLTPEDQGTNLYACDLSE